MIYIFHYKMIYIITEMNKSRIKNKKSSTNEFKSLKSSKKNDNQYNTSWYEFVKPKTLNISVKLDLIPLPTTKPKEIKDRLNPFYGSEVVELSPAINCDLHLDYSQKGVAILYIEHGSQCQKLGFQVGDIILTVDNKRMKKISDIENIQMQHRKNCRIKFKRNGKINHVDVYLRQRKRYYSRL